MERLVKTYFDAPHRPEENAAPDETNPPSTPQDNTPLVADVSSGGTEGGPGDAY
jgi:hypothetical protein